MTRYGHFGERQQTGKREPLFVFFQKENSGLVTRSMNSLQGDGGFAPLWRSCFGSVYAKLIDTNVSHGPRIDVVAGQQAVFPAGAEQTLRRTYDCSCYVGFVLRVHGSVP